MSRIAFIADIHVGNPSAFGGHVDSGINHRGQLILDSLKEAGRTILREKCDALVICGDLFDVADPPPQMVSRVMAILASLKGVKVHIIMGNHDMVSDAPLDNALGPLAFLPNVKVHEICSNIDIGGTELLLVPFQVGDCREWFADAVAACRIETSSKKRVLAFHLGVVDEKTPEFLAHAHDAIPLQMLQQVVQEHSIDHAFCGNWHSPGRWGNVHQVGALVPTGWDNPGWDYGRVMILDTEINNATPVHVPGPRFLTATSMDEVLVLQQEAKRRKCNLFLSLKAEASKHLDEVRAMGISARAVADTTAVREATRAAAVAVRKASTLEEALAKYVQAMPLEDGIKRDQVQAMAASYLAKGGN